MPRGQIKTGTGLSPEKRQALLDELFLVLTNDGDTYKDIYPIVESGVKDMLRDVESILKDVIRHSRRDMSIAQVNLMREDLDAKENLAQALVDYYSRDMLILNGLSDYKTRKEASWQEEIERLSAELSALHHTFPLPSVDKLETKSKSEEIMSVSREDAPIIRKVTEVGGTDISALSVGAIRTKIKELREIIKDNKELVEEGSAYATKETEQAQEAIKVLVAELDSRVK